jgi:thiol-disulfide isomerase/thioredoxin
VKFYLSIAVLTLAVLAGCEGSFDEPQNEQAPILAPVPEPFAEPAPVERRQVFAFQAKWCDPCQQDKPELAKLDSELEIIRIDADQRPDLIQQYNVTALPTYIVMKDGREVERDCSLSKIIKVLKFWRWLRSK